LSYTRVALEMNGNRERRDVNPQPELPSPQGGWNVKA